MTGKIRKRADFIINVIYIAAVAFVIYVVLKLADLALPFVLAFLIIAVLQPVIRFLQRKIKINNKIISVAILLIVYLIIGGILAFAITQLVLFLLDMFEGLPAYYDTVIVPTVQNIGDRFEGLFQMLPDILPKGLENLETDILAKLYEIIISLSQSGLSALGGFVEKIPSFLIALVFTFILTFFISTRYDEIVVFFVNQLSKRGADILGSMRGLLNNTILRYLRAVLILMAITFVELSVGLLIIGTSKAVGVAAIIAIFDALPIFGTGAIMIPWIVIQLLQGEFAYAIGLGVLYALVTIIRNIIEPKIVGDQLGLNPVVSLMSIYIGYRLVGVVGMIFFPMIAQILIVLHENGTIKLYKSYKKEPPIDDMNEISQPPTTIKASRKKPSRQNQKEND